MKTRGTASPSSPLKNWFIRIAWILAGAVLGAAALVAIPVVILGWLFLIGSGRETNSPGNNVTLPEEAWKPALVILAILILAGWCYFNYGWQIALLVLTGLGAGVGAILGLAVRMSRERKNQRDGFRLAG